MHYSFTIGMYYFEINVDSYAFKTIIPVCGLLRHMTLCHNLWTLSLVQKSEKQALIKLCRSSVDVSYIHRRFVIISMPRSPNTRNMDKTFLTHNFEVCEFVTKVHLKLYQANILFTTDITHRFVKITFTTNRGRR